MVGHKSDHQRDAEETLGCSGRYYINDLVVCNHNGEQVPGLAELRLSFSQLTGLNKHQVDHTAPHSTTLHTLTGRYLPLPYGRNVRLTPNGCIVC